MKRAILLLTLVGLLAVLTLSGCQRLRLSYFGPHHMYRWSGGGVLLTFDDGPSPNTLRILDILNARGVKAAFFLRGDNAERYPEIVRAIADGGHYIGNHTYSHAKLLDMPLSVAKQEVLQTQAIIDPYGARKWFRPPWGELPRDLSDWLESQGYTIVRWSSVSADNLKDGDILLMHETDSVVERLPSIIDTAERVSGHGDR